MLLIPVLFVTCPVTRDTDPSVPVSTPDVRVLWKVSKGLQETGGQPHPCHCFLLSCLLCLKPSCINLLKVLTLCIHNRASCSL